MIDADSIFKYTFLLSAHVEHAAGLTRPASWCFVFTCGAQSAGENLTFRICCVNVRPAVLHFISIFLTAILRSK